MLVTQLPPYSSSSIYFHSHARKYINVLSLHVIICVQRPITVVIEYNMQHQKVSRNLGSLTDLNYPQMMMIQVSVLPRPNSL